MKQFKLVQGFILSISIAMLLFSCSSGEEKKADETVADSSATAKNETPTPPATPVSVNLMVIRHKVANYAKWKPHYDEFDSARLSHGLHNYVIARGTEDSNMVLVSMKMDDINKAKELGASKELKDKMKIAGVTGTPIIDYVESVMYDTSAMQQTVRLLITHKVKDWDTWKKAFDSHKQIRTDAGLTDRLVAYSVGNNKNVCLVFAVNDIDKAKAFIKSKDLKDKMADAGVEGPPVFFFYKVVERY